MYFPNISSFKLPYLNNIFKTSKEEPIRYTDTPALKESTMSDGTYPYNSAPVTVQRELTNFIPGTFDSCTIDDCSSITVLESAENSSLIQKTYSITDDTLVLCVNRYIDGNDTSDTFIDFSNPLDSVYKELRQDRLTALQKYTKDAPIQHDYIDDKLTWISIYLDNCNDFK
jgi:hypothetical protein